MPQIAFVANVLRVTGAVWRVKERRHRPAPGGLDSAQRSAERNELAGDCPGGAAAKRGIVVQFAKEGLLSSGGVA